MEDMRAVLGSALAPSGGPNGGAMDEREDAGSRILSPDAPRQDPPAEPDLPPPSQDDVLRFDFSLPVLEVLGFVLESYSPESAASLRWPSAGFSCPPHDQDAVCILDFFESEVSYSEFQMCLCRFAERAKISEACLDRLPLAQCLQGFLQLVFKPSLHTRYQFQTAGDVVPATAREAAEEQAGQEAEQKGPTAEVRPQETEAAALEFWLGFEDEYFEAECLGLRVRSLKSTSMRWLHGDC
jgi:hypothetical protein